MKFSIGGSEFERLEVIVHGFEGPETGEYYDDNWISVTVKIATGGFRGECSAFFLTMELADFSHQLQNLYDTLHGKACFETMEGQLTLTLSGDGKGRILVEGDAADSTDRGNHLKFTFSIDQTQLREPIRELKGIISRFPVRNA
jgi:hypothetical protein